MAKAPSWVLPAADAPLVHAKPVEAGDFDYLMVDQQVRLSAVTEQYSRFVERMVNQASIARAAQIAIEIDPGHERLTLHDVRATFVNDRPAGDTNSALPALVPAEA